MIDREAVRRQHRHTDYRALVRHPVVILGDHVDKQTNIGGIVRTAEAFLVEAVMFDRDPVCFGGGMGAQFWQPIEWNVDLPAKIRELRQRGYRIAALDQGPRARPLASYTFPKRVALIVGAELFGISTETRSLADDILYIPQLGLVKSLNVHVAAAIALYEYARQHWMSNVNPAVRHL